MSQPLVVDSGAAENSHTENVVSEPQDSRIKRVQARCILLDSRRQYCGKRRREDADHVNSRAHTLGK